MTIYVEKIDIYFINYYNIKRYLSKKLCEEFFMTMKTYEYNEEKKI